MSSISSLVKTIKNNSQTNNILICTQVLHALLFHAKYGDMV